jgi:hypothetical protein
LIKAFVFGGWKACESLAVFFVEQVALNRHVSVFKISTKKFSLTASVPHYLMRQRQLEVICKIELLIIFVKSQLGELLLRYNKFSKLVKRRKKVKLILKQVHAAFTLLPA